MKTALVALLFIGLLSKSAEAHEPPPMWFNYELKDDKLVCEFKVMAVLFDQWLSLSRLDLMYLSDEERPSHLKALKEWFDANPIVEIDGVVVAPIIRAIEFKKSDFHNIELKYVVLTLDFSIKAPPKKVLLRWKDFNVFDEWPMKSVDALFAWGDEEAAYFLTNDEPEVTWHASKKKTVNKLRFMPPPAPPRINIPVLSLALGCGALVFLCLGFFLKLAKPMTIGIPLVLVVAAWAGQDQMVRRIRPPWLSAPVALTVPEAQEIFEALQQNTYRAFDYEDESRIYDALAQSVDGDLLERLYIEIFDSLIIREEGGAVCTVRKVDIIKNEVTLSSDPERREFLVNATWRVHGRVGHFGHQHLRVNQYSADYILRENEAGWRINDVKISNQERLDPMTLKEVKDG